MNADSVQILVVSSREDRVQDLKALLTEADFGASHLVWCDSLDEALECLSTGTIDITVVNGLDDHFTLDICIRLAKDAPYVPIVLWIPSSEEHIAENAFAHGVTDILILGQTSPRQIARNLRHAHWRNLYAKRNHHLRLRAQTVIDALPEIIGFKDKEGRYIAVNRAFERHTQRTEADILGKRDIELFDESIARNHMWSDRLALERNNMVRVKQVHPNPDGSMRHYETTKICMPNPDGRGVALVNISLDVTERKRIEEAFARERALLRTLVDTLPAAVYIKDTQGRFLLANEATAAVLNAPAPEALIGKTDFDFLPRDRAEKHHAGETELLSGKNESLNTSLTYLDATQTTHYYQIIKVPFRDSADNIIGLVGITLDITEQKQAEAAVIESEREYRILVESVPGAIYRCHTDAHYTTLFISDAIESITGYPPSDFIDGSVRTLANIILEEDRTRVRATVDHAIGRKEPYIVEYRITHRDGSVRWVYERGLGDFAPDGTLRWLVGCMVDITDHKRAEEERREFDAQVQHAQKLESLGVLAGGIAHDFNNLLMAILGNADLALMELPPTSPLTNYIEQIVSASRRAADLCQQMLSYAGRGQFSMQPMYIEDIVAEMSGMLTVSISKQVTLRYEFTENTPPIMADRAQISQIIMNLILNASEAMSESDGVIRVATGVTRCDAAYLAEMSYNEGLEGGEYVYIEVTDSGCGMDQETLGRIFEPFFSTKFLGRGLGMAAVLGIVRGHHGAINVQSSPGQGSTFTILFPPFSEPARPEIESSVELSTWRGSGVILLVDDEESIRVVGKLLLERLGFEVLLAADGREAVKQYEKNAHRIGCVLLDLTMPAMGGERTFQEIRKIRNDAQVVLCSGYNEQDIIQRFSDSGLVGFIQKPYHSRDLIHILQRIFENSDAPSATS